MIYLYSLLLILLAVYSYVLVDLNLTFFNSGLWNVIRERLIYLGYFQRDLSVLFYLAIIILLFLFHFYFIKKYKQFDPFKISLIIGLILLFSYPFLSHDFFNYMFDAKILTFYHQNPYLHRALDFPNDPWIRFMQWTHRTYPYGPSFLLITLIPSFLGLGKFLLSFMLFKAMFVIFYLKSVYLLGKMNKKYAIIFATSPLIIVEGLVSSHNDLIAVALAIIGIYYLQQKKNILSRIFLLFSGGIKYVTMPLIFLSLKNKKIQLAVFVALIGLIGYLSVFSEIQPWYFLSLFLLLPFYEKLVVNLNIFFAGLLFSYYPYVRFGEWGTIGNVNSKHQIIIFFLVLNGVYFLVNKLRAKFLMR